MSSNNEIFRQRTKQFALRVIWFCDTLPKTTASFVLSKQLLRSCTSVAANYRAVGQARSDRERYAKLCIVMEEADETLFWLELLSESGIADHQKINELLQEATEFTKVFSAYKSKLKHKTHSP